MADINHLSEGSYLSSPLGFYFDATRCTGCKTCALACKDYHDLSKNFAFRQVYEYGGGDWERDEQGAWHHTVNVCYLSLACNHCASPVCIQVCPTGAMHKDPNGLVSVDVKRCIGCGYCELSCPYRVPKVDRERGHSTKCDGCKDRVSEGLRPICVEACSVRAIEFAPIEDLREAHGICDEIAPLPPADQTHPHLVIRPPKNYEALSSRSHQMRIINTPDIV